MQKWNAFVTIAGLSACQAAEENKPQKSDTQAPRAFDIGTITEVKSDSLGVLNARSSHHGPIFYGGDAGCLVRVVSETPLPAGALGATESIECPKTMRYEAFEKCGFGLVSRRSDAHCICEPWSGNPPPPPFDVPCPVKDD